MRTIAKWAKTNLWTARILLIFLQTFLVLVALDLGLWLAAGSLFIPDIIINCVVIMIGASVLINPSKQLRKINKRYFNHWALRARLLLIVSGFLAFIILGNQLPGHLDIQRNLEITSMEGQAMPVVYDLKPQRSNETRADEMRERTRHLNQKPSRQYRVKKNKKRERRRQRIAKQNRKVWKKRLRQQVKQRYEAKRSLPNTITGLVLLDILLFFLTILMIFLTVGFSCNLACAGHNFVAWLAIGMGLAIIILIFSLSLRIGRKIKRLKLEKRQGN